MGERGSASLRADRSTRWPDIGLWALRALWLVLPFVMGPGLADAIDGRSPGVRAVASVMAWGGWTATLVALLVPRTTSLTVARIAAPAALVTECWAAGPGNAAEPGVDGVVGIVVCVVICSLVWAPVVSDGFVNGSAYGTERRFVLRLPPLLAVLALPAWLVVATGVVTGPLLLAARQWLTGAVVLALGAPFAAAAARSLHSLSRRWLVFVPAGLVVHDPVARPESVMVPKPLIVRLAPALKESDAFDLTLGAPGLALELELSAPLPITVRRGIRSLGTEAVTTALIAPARTAAVLAEAEDRGVRVI
jgi:hypothetical protein